MKESTKLYLGWLMLTAIGMGFMYFQGYHDAGDSWRPVVNSSIHLSESSMNLWNDSLAITNTFKDAYLLCDRFTQCQEKCLYVTRAANFSDCYWRCKE